MPYPGYLLNPGDMFQVEPERVLYATGASKSPEQIREGREKRKAKRLIHIRRHERRATAREEAVKRATAKPVPSDDPSSLKGSRGSFTPLDDKETRKQRRADLQELVKQVQIMMENKKAPPSAKRKQELRKFVKDVRQTMAQVNRKPVDDLEEDLSGLVARLALTAQKAKPTEKPGTSVAAVPSTPSTTPSTTSKVPDKVKDAESRMRRAILRARQNPVDESKPYATPWAPRPYMSAFAFIPRYLEVNHKICSAVYLRHPVARPGLSEVPTPFAYDTMQLAYTWYLRRR